MSNKKYLDEARRQIELASSREGRYRGACSKCEFSRLNLLGRYCVHPAVEVACFNTEPAYSEYLADCNQQRSSRSSWGAVVCGPDGALFQRRKLRFWQRLVGL